ncbi:MULTISPECIES: tetratricopeptide repeat-containing protein [Acinetobacter]|uniref:tetratricopeptide repeat-containing protein n=1 Tax=Acinetobacter TaxID=469 RepID=UPI0021CDDADC|nr:MULTISPECIES: tetratricopeptide repeat-containing protein [Acinetobacter]MCU4310318.1 hypothetical protein [Acinetobacter radioresistens]MCU4568401.1 hypothetical protein [Acinetobacter radioresistens]
MSEKICFVVMGFGKKTDFATGRLLNLDATYENIIKPAVELTGYRCIRADDINHSGVIDLHMYKMLLIADLVIADISTTNANALYELGVRHALKNKTTIILSEDQSALHFDLNHVATIQYQHNGDDISASESTRIINRLKRVIEDATQGNEPDSPVYTFLPKLQMPVLDPQDMQSIIEEAQSIENQWSTILFEAEDYIRKSEFNKAKIKFKEALDLNPNDSYLIQRLTLATYKAEKPNKVMALMEALQVLNPLDYKTSNDPETTGLAGAINKRLWQETQTKEFLEEAIVAYKRGFILKKDYYNGENLVLCNLLMSNLYDETSTLRTYHLVEAEKVIKDVLASIEKIFDSSSPELREDYKWILATAANLSFFINQDHMKYEERFLTLADEWEVKTYRESQEIFSSFKVT